MLLAIDIGNTHTVLGFFEGGALKQSFRIQSDAKNTVDEYAVQVLSLLRLNQIEPDMIRRVIIACVVPALTRVFTKLSTKYLNQTPHVVGLSTRTEMEIRYQGTVGADRIVNAVAARKRFGQPCVVVDFGTATTFDVVGKDGAYEGGIITPGIGISADALFSRAALLPTIELAKPSTLIGKNTKDAMLSGLIFGYAELVDGLLTRIRAEIGQNMQVIATGGLATLIAAECKGVSTVVGELTLLGLHDLAEMNPR